MQTIFQIINQENILLQLTNIVFTCLHLDTKKHKLERRYCIERQNTADSLLPDPITSSLYIPGYLNTQIGKLLKVEFLVGTTITDRIGVLVKVGVSYILLRPIDVNGLLLCDLYSIKFVTIVERPDLPIFGGIGGM